MQIHVKVLKHIRRIKNGIDGPTADTAAGARLGLKCRILRLA